MWLLKHNWRTLLHVLLIVVLSLFVSQTYWMDHFPYTHDGENHLVRFVNYAAAIRDGQFPPRFAPYLFSGYGFPVFHYNYPLANILALPFSLLRVSPEYIFRGQVLLALLLGASSVWSLIYRSPWKQSRWFGMTLFLTSTYLVNLLIFRGNIGEIWAYCLFPLAVWGWSKLWQTNDRVYAWSLVPALVGLLLAHNLFSLMLGGILVLLTGVVSVRQKQQKLWGLIWLLSTTLTTWFWVPAVAELGLVVLRQDALANEATQHLLSWSQLIWSPWQFGFSRPGPLDTLSFALGLPSWLVFVLAISLGFKIVWQVKSRRQEWRILPTIGISGALITILWSLWLSTDSARWVWENFSFIHILQFPWRFQILSVFSVIVLGSWLYTHIPYIGKVVLWMALVIQFVMIGQLHPADRFHYENEYYLTSASSTLTRNENRPRTLNKSTYESWAPHPKVIRGDGQIVQVNSWLGSQRAYQVEAQTDITVSEPTVYFPGWTIHVEEQRFPVDTEANEGLIAYNLPARPGKPYTVTTRFTESILIRQLSDGISLAALVGWVGWGMQVLWPAIKKIRWNR
jgi:hypothetical protein